MATKNKNNERKKLYFAKVNLYVYSFQIDFPVIVSTHYIYIYIYKIGVSMSLLKSSQPVLIFTLNSKQPLSSINLKGKVELNILFELKELRILDLSGNKVWVSISNINSTVPKFSFLWLSSCNLLEFPDFLKYQKELRFLDLSNNNIKGKIPKWFWNVGKETLRCLNLSFNILSKFE